MKAANTLLPIFVEHELWRPRERAWIGDAMRSADIARLRSEVDHGVRLARSLGVDVGDVAAAVLAPDPDRVQVVRHDLVGADDQVFDVVVLGVDVAAGEGVCAARGEHVDELRGELGRGPREVVAVARGHVGLDEARADQEDADAVRGDL